MPAIECRGVNTKKQSGHLTTETIEGTALALESIDDIERGDRLALGVFGVGDGVTNDRLEEGLEDTTGLFVDHCDAVSKISWTATATITY
jgi:hypothetical protein